MPEVFSINSYFTKASLQKSMFEKKTHIETGERPKQEFIIYNNEPRSPGLGTRHVTREMKEEAEEANRF